MTAPSPKLDRYIVIHVATTCDEHGVYVTKDSAEVIELGWILLDTKTCEEVYIFYLSILGVCVCVCGADVCCCLVAPGKCPRQARQHSHHAPLQ